VLAVPGSSSGLSLYPGSSGLDVRRVLLTDDRQGMCVTVLIWAEFATRCTMTIDQFFPDLSKMDSLAGVKLVDSVSVNAVEETKLPKSLQVHLLV